MAIRKNKKFIDPRYFMDEKTEIIKEELEKLDEIPTWRRLQPEAHPGQHPGPLKGETEKEDLEKPPSREEWFQKLWPDRQGSSIEDLHAEADAAREAGNRAKADALDDMADHLDIQKDMRSPEPA